MLSTNSKNTIVNGLIGRNQYFTTSVYIGLSSTAPNADGSGITEPTGNGYGRVLIGSVGQTLTHKFGEAADGESTNTDNIYFPESTGSWGAPLTHFVLFKSKSGTDANDVIGFDTLKDNGVASPITVSAAQTVAMFRIGAVTVKCEDAN